jgi:hypothetical protein
MNLKIENLALLLGIIVNDEDREKYKRVATLIEESNKDIRALVDQSAKL